MHTHEQKQNEIKTENSSGCLVSSKETAGSITDCRPTATIQRKLQDEIQNSLLFNKDKSLLQKIHSNSIECQQKDHGQSIKTSSQESSNHSGLPLNLKSGIEQLSGFLMDDVKVHYNSPKPSNMQAHAYAQGNEIHLGTGQEKYLPHEAWHLVQQKQGRVKGTKQMKGQPINDDISLEKEADEMGAKAMNGVEGVSPLQFKSIYSQNVIQRHVGLEIELDIPVYTKSKSDIKNMSDDLYGFLYSRTKYTRKDISGNAANQGYKVQLDHGSKGKNLDTINEKFKEDNILSETPGCLANLEFVIGGDHGIDEESANGLQQITTAINSVVTVVNKVTKDVKDGKSADYGDYRTAFPYEELKTYNDKENDEKDKEEVIKKYYKVLNSLQPEVFVQLTAGIRPEAVNKVMKSTNLLTSSDGLGSNTKKLVGEHTKSNASDGFGFSEYFKLKPANKDHKEHYQKMMLGYVTLMTQEVYSFILRHKQLGNWDENRKGVTSKNSEYMLPHSSLSKIIPNSAPAGLLTFISDTKKELKAIIERKLTTTFSGGFLGGNIDVTKSAVKESIDSNDLPDSITLEDRLKKALPGLITQVVDGFFSEVGGENKDFKSMSPHNFAYHPSDPNDMNKGNKIPLEMRHLKNNTMMADALPGYLVKLLADLKKINQAK